MRIILSGGGTGGPVSPLLAVALEIKKLHPKADFLFVGTKHGPERQMVEQLGLPFRAIHAAKFRRYLSLMNISIPFTLTAGFIQALSIVRKFKPEVIFSAGGYVAVPVAWAGKIYGARIIIHQQDARIGLANKLIAPFADTITAAFEQTSKDFYSGSGLFNSRWHAAVWVGNPVRSDIAESKVDIKKYFNLHDDLPVLLILGGATGSAQINKLIGELLPNLVTAHQIVHQTGKGKNIIDFKHPNYHPFEIIPYQEYAAILKAAHLVVARAGLSTIAELSALRKPAIIIPMPNTHQEENAKILLDSHSAVVLTGTEVTSENLAKVINSLKFNQKRIEMLTNNIAEVIPKDAAARIAKIILNH